MSISAVSGPNWLFASPARRLHEMKQDIEAKLKQKMEAGAATATKPLVNIVV